MNKKQFDKLEKSLLNEKGYRKYNQHWRREDYGIGKGFHKSDNKWEEDRSVYQIILCVYDYTLHPEFFDRIPKEQRDHVGVEVCFLVSRTVDESMELVFEWHDDTTIEEVEQKAESFYQWVCKEYPEPRKE